MPRDKEKQKLRYKRYRKIHKEQLIAYCKSWRKANRERLKASTKAYREANSGKRSLYQKSWRKDNREKVKGYIQSRRALKYKAPFEPINDKRVFLRDGWICQICHKRVNKRFKHPNPMSASLDHIVPLSKGGTHTYANVQLTHLKCNQIKKTNTLPQGEQLRIF